MAEETLAKLAELTAKQIGVDKAKVVPEANLMDDLGADSLDLMELVMEIEDAFGVTVPDEVLKSGGLKTVGDVVSYIEKAKKVA